MGNHAYILDFGEIDGIVVVFQKDGLPGNDDSAVGDDHHVEIIIDNLQIKGVDVEDGNDDDQKSEKRIEKGDLEQNDDGTQDQEEEEAHGADQETEKNGLQKMSPMSAEKELYPLVLQRWSDASSLTHIVEIRIGGPLFDFYRITYSTMSKPPLSYR